MYSVGCDPSSLGFVGAGRSCSLWVYDSLADSPESTVITLRLGFSVTDTPGSVASRTVYGVRSATSRIKGGTLLLRSSPGSKRLRTPCDQGVRRNQRAKLDTSATLKPPSEGIQGLSFRTHQRVTEVSHPELGTCPGDCAPSAVVDRGVEGTSKGNTQTTGNPM